MKIITWQFHNIKIPMIRINGKLYTTSYVLAAALSVTSDELIYLYRKYKEEFDETCLRLSLTQPKDRFRETFGIERLRPDMHLWSTDNMMDFGFLNHSDVGREFKRGVKRLLNKEAHTYCPTAREVEKIRKQLVAMTERALQMESERDREKVGRVLAEDHAARAEEWAKKCMLSSESTQKAMATLQEEMAPAIAAVREQGSAFGKGLQATKALKPFIDMN